MSSIDYKAVFEALGDFEGLRRNGNRVAKEFDNEYDDYGSGYEIYLVGNAYVKLEIYVNSYGNDFEITGVGLVEPKKIVVTDFEPVNF